VVYIDDHEFVMADLPGLIEDAHLGVGLGDKFLKHIERCKVILHLIDVMEEDIVKSYQIIRHELESYSPLLKDKKEIVVLNKCDCFEDQELLAKKMQEIASYSQDQDVMMISAATGANITQVLRKLMKLISDEDYSLKLDDTITV
jgi:GTP-binding protein